MFSTSLDGMYIATKGTGELVGSCPAFGFGSSCDLIIQTCETRVRPVRIRPHHGFCTTSLSVLFRSRSVFLSLSRLFGCFNVFRLALQMLGALLFVLARKYSRFISQDLFRGCRGTICSIRLSRQPMATAHISASLFLREISFFDRKFTYHEEIKAASLVTIVTFVRGAKLAPNFIVVRTVHCAWSY